ncbi:MAG: hypothetical protein ABEI54_05315, partial [Candidatus Bipolaricaulia bacterium]
RAMEALAENGYEPEEKGVVLVELSHRPGMLEHITDRLAREGIDLNYLYSSNSLEEDESLIVLDSSDNEKTIKLLNNP